MCVHKFDGEQFFQGPLRWKLAVKLVCGFQLMLYYQIYGWALLGAPASLEGNSAETNSTKTDDAVVHVREEHKILIKVNQSHHNP